MACKLLNEKEIKGRKMETKNMSKKEREYLDRIEKLTNEMLHLSFNGLKEINKNKYLAICGLLRDSAFKIKQMLKQEK